MLQIKIHTYSSLKNKIKVVGPNESVCHFVSLFVDSKKIYESVPNVKHLKKITFFIKCINEQASMCIWGLCWFTFLKLVLKRNRF